MINNRQNGRRRGRGGNNNNSNPRQGGGGGGGRADSGNRIDSRARGNANQLYEKYKNLARDAQMSGDRVNIEYYLQYADHYFRVLADTRSRFEDNNQPRRQQPFDLDGDDDDDNAEGEPIRSGEQNGQRDDRGNRETGRETGRDSGRETGRDSARESGRESGRDSNRDAGRDRSTDSTRDRHAETGREGGRDSNRDGERMARAPRRPRDESLREDGDIAQPRRTELANDRDDSERPSRPRRERTERADAADSAAVSDDQAAAPRRRGRPRKEQPGDDAPAAIAADVLPPSLGASLASAPANDGDAEPKPRRRRVTRAVEDVPSAAE